ncbi:MAG: phosphoribosylformimino-5-aminoimidazole carboxamide ribotide isomerase [SAR324 cluster bacterium]|nr:phosphoribosylformimino-5-aminoimidazole carboxamide ribotide isomerase [SAR324 cluster bacterium]
MKFRPCIDLHNGKVRQIIGSTLASKDKLKVNFTSDKNADWFAKIYKSYGLQDGHVVRLGNDSDNDKNCVAALKAYPNNLRLGGGINLDNAAFWIDTGAKAVVVTSYIFEQEVIDFTKLSALKQKIGKERIVIDLSCAPDQNNRRWIYLNCWKKRSAEMLTADLLKKLSTYCHGFLIHSIKQEGLAQGVDKSLISFLGDVATFPVVYAGGVSSEDDLKIIKSAGRGIIDFTVGSALDIFGGTGLKLSHLAKEFS